MDTGRVRADGFLLLRVLPTTLGLLLMGAGCQGQAPQPEKFYTLTIITGMNADGTPQIKTQQISEADEIAQRDAWEAESKSRSGAEVAVEMKPGGKIGPIAQPETHGLTYSYYCDSSYFWAFDGSHEVGNAVCFKTYFVSGDGYYGGIDLNNLCLDGGSGGCSNNWWAKIRSYWVPYDDSSGNGLLQNNNGGSEFFSCAGHLTTCGSFPGYSCCQWNSWCGTTHEAGTYGQQSRYVWLGAGNYPYCYGG